MVTVNLGDKVKDTISGLVGIATSRTTFLYGCVRVCVQPESKDGKATEGVYIDEPQLAVVKVGAVKGLTRDVHGARPDVTRPAATRASDARR